MLENMRGPTFLFSLISVFVVAVNCVPVPGGCENSSRFERFPCGYTGVNETTCKNLDCCFDSSFSVPCFYPDIDVYIRKHYNVQPTIPTSYSWKGSDGLSGHVKLNHVSGPKGTISEDGASIGVDATLFEVGARRSVDVDGFRWVGAGYTVGLSATTEAKVGLKETGFKLAGTGMSIGSEKGLEFCMFGNCVSLG